MQINPAPCLETFFDLIQDVIHPLRGGQAKIPNGKAIVDSFHVVGPGLLEQDVCIRDHFIDAGEIDECVETGFEQGVEAFTSKLLVELAGIFSRKESTWLYPIGLMNGTLKFCHITEEI